MTTYSSNSKVIKFVGVIVASMGSFMILFIFVGEPVIVKILFTIITLVFLFFAVMCFQYKCIVTIDTDNQTVQKEVYTKLWNKIVQYHFSDFDKVQILMGAGGSSSISTNIHTIYIIHLVGRSKVCIPSSHKNLQEAQVRGREIADTIGKPFVEKPKVGFILNVFERCT